MKYLAILALSFATFLLTLPFASATVASETSQRGIVSITFDDATALEWNGFSIAQKYQFPGTLYVMIDNVGTSWGLTWDQIREMHQHGWEIGSHTVTHPDLTTINEQEKLSYELSHSKARNHEEIGEPPVSFASPFGRYSESVLHEVAKHYPLHVTAWSDTPATDGKNQPDSVDALRISRIDVGAPQISAAEVCNMIDEAGKQNIWLVLLFHTISTEEPGEYQMHVDTFDAIMKCLHTSVTRNSVYVATVRDAYTALRK